MLRFRRLLISLLAALAAAGLVYAVYMTLLHQVELQETTTVIVPGRFIQEGTVITEDLLTHRTVLKATVDSDMFIDADELIGRQTLIPLGEGEPVLRWKLSDLVLLPLEQESTFEVPKEYIRSISGGVREGDLVRIYVSGDGNERRLLLEDVRVASVRLSDDSRSRESSEPQGQADQHQRLLALRAAKQVDRINLNLTEDQWLLLDRACTQPDGGKLVIALPGDQTVLSDLLETVVQPTNKDMPTNTNLPIESTVPSTNQPDDQASMVDEANLPHTMPIDAPDIVEGSAIQEATPSDRQALPLDTAERDRDPDDEEGGEDV